MLLKLEIIRKRGLQLQYQSQGFLIESNQVKCSRVAINLKIQKTMTTGNLDLKDKVILQYIIPKWKRGIFRSNSLSTFKISFFCFKVSEDEMEDEERIERFFIVAYFVVAMTGFQIRLSSLEKNPEFQTLTKKLLLVTVVKGD